jgi:hypothetical protein
VGFFGGGSSDIGSETGPSRKTFASQHARLQLYNL